MTARTLDDSLQILKGPAGNVDPDYREILGAQDCQ